MSKNHGYHVIENHKVYQGALYVTDCGNYVDLSILIAYFRLLIRRTMLFSKL